MGGIRCPWCPEGFQSTEPASPVKNRAARIQRRIPPLHRVQPRETKTRTLCAHERVLTTVDASHVICTHVETHEPRRDARPALGRKEVFPDSPVSQCEDLVSAGTDWIARRSIPAEERAHTGGPAPACGEKPGVIAETSA